MKNRSGIFLECFTALALIFSYVETLIPIQFGIPGVKLGLANGVIMVLLFFTTWTRTLEISVIRVVLAGFLFGNPMTIAYSLAGGILSLVIDGTSKEDRRILTHWNQRWRWSGALISGSSVSLFS